MAARSSSGGAPGWRENRAHRIARQRNAKAQQRQSRADERAEAQEEEARPATRGKQPARSTKPSAIVSRDRLKKQRSGIERVLAWLVLLLSFLGSIAAFHGGFGPLIASLSSGELNAAALLSGILVQLIVTFLEWYYFDRPLIAWGARIVDTATTAIGFGPLFLSPLMIALAGRGVAAPLALAWMIILITALLIAWFPESRLVD